MSAADENRPPAERFETYLAELERDPVFQDRLNRIAVLKELRPLGLGALLVVGVMAAFVVLAVIVLG